MLYVCHGSRLPKALQEAISFIEKCQKRIPADIHEISFLELATPSIREGFRACVEKGATHIAVVPLLLFSANHAKVDIPHEIRQLKGQFPFIKVTYGQPIGVHEKMAEIVIERIKQSFKVEQIEPMSKVILIGRGSTDEDAARDFQKIAHLVQQLSGISSVKTCYLHAAEPSFEDVLKQDTIQREVTRNIYFVPYLLFTGLLMKEIERKVRHAKQINPHIHLCRYLGYDVKTEEVFIERVIEAMVNQNKTKKIEILSFDWT